MTVKTLKNILKNCKDDADIMLVCQIGAKQLIVDDLIDFAPSDGSDSLSAASGIYFYGDSCDFLHELVSLTFNEED